MRHILPTLTCSAYLLLLPATGETPKSVTEGPQLTPEQTATILKQLDTIEAQMNKNRADLLSSAVAKFSKALSNGEAGATQMYLDCYKLNHFDRLNQPASEFQAWQKRNQDKLDEPEFMLARYIQLQYLMFCMKVQDAPEKEIPSLVTSLQTHVSNVLSAFQNAARHNTAAPVIGKSTTKKGAHNQHFDCGKFQNLLRQPVKNSEFAKAFLLDDFLKKENWPYDPMDIKGIYEQVILPYYLDKKPSEIPAIWDTRIKTELGISAAVMPEANYAAHYKENYPRMLWSKADYLVAHNITPTSAMADMLKIIRENPSHPDMAQWAKKLRELVNNAQPTLLPSGSETQPATATTPPAQK